MATGMTPSVNDTKFILWKKISWNLYNFALHAGASGLTAPNWNDTLDILYKKSAYYSAAAVDNLV